MLPTKWEIKRVGAIVSEQWGMEVAIVGDKRRGQQERASLLACGKGSLVYHVPATYA